MGAWPAQPLSESFPRQHDLDRVVRVWSQSCLGKTPLFHP